MSERIFDAMEFAQKAHRGQYRKCSPVPFIVHPMWIMQRLIREGCSEDVVIAGLLHDVVEDTPYTLQDIQKLFGNRVAELVLSVSEPDKSLSWQERKDHTMAYFDKCNDTDSLYILAADKLHNVLSMKTDYERLGDALWLRYNAPKERQKWYYTSIADILIKHSKSKDDIFRIYHDVTYGFFQSLHI